MGLGLRCYHSAVSDVPPTFAKNAKDGAPTSCLIHNEDASAGPHQAVVWWSDGLLIRVFDAAMPVIASQLRTPL
jgi:hypothetical protein